MSGAASFSYGRSPKRLLRLLVLVVIGMVMCLPFVWMVCSSFKTRAEVDDVQHVQVLPRDPTLENYPILLNLKPDPVSDRYLNLKFGRWYFNSVFTAGAITFLQVLTSAMAAYAFSRMRWKGRDTVFLLYLATMTVPGLVLMIPNYQTLVTLGLRDTYLGVILPLSFTAFGTFLLRQFMLSIPPALDEAARIDGAGHWRIFWDVIMPLSRPGIIALTIFSMLAAYQSFFWPLVTVESADLYTLPIGMLSLDSSYGRQTELIMAAAVLNVIPLIIVFVFLQKFLVKGIQLGAVKG